MTMGRPNMLNGCSYSLYAIKLCLANPILDCLIKLFNVFFARLMLFDTQLVDFLCRFINLITISAKSNEY